jgi:hypothetical protein
VTEAARDQGPERGRLSTRAAAWLALTLASLTLVMNAASVALIVLGAEPIVINMVLTVPYWALPVVGALIASKRPHNPIGWICLAGGLLLSLYNLSWYYGLAVPDSVPFPVTIYALGNWLLWPSIGLLGIYLLLLFPDGRLTSRRWRLLAWISGVAIGLASVAWFLTPGPLIGIGGERNPFGLEGLTWVAEAVRWVFIVLLLCIIASAVNLVLRYRRSRGEVRQQVKWLIYATSVVVVGALGTIIGTSFVLPSLGAVFWRVTLLGFAAMPVAIGIAIIRHHLYDIDLLSPLRNRARVYAPPAILSGRWLLAARVVWVALATLSVVVFVASVTVGYPQLRTLCEGAECDFGLAGSLSPEDVRALEKLGFSLDFYAASRVVLSIAWALGYWMIAAILFWKGSQNKLALLASISFVTSGAAGSPFYASLWNAYPSWHLALGLLVFVGSVSYFVLFCVFPDGRFVPRWTRWVTAACVPTALYLSFFFVSDVSFLSSSYSDLVDPSSEPSSFSPRLLLSLSRVVLAVLIIFLLSGSLVVAQIYRYLRVSGPVARQQTKWIVLGLAVTFAVFAGLSFIPASNLFYQLVSVPLIYVVFFLIPLAFAVAILRYRLWEIDFIINRTLLYGSLSVALAAVFAITEQLLQSLVFFMTGTGEQSGVITFASVVVIAIAFQPLRQRIERVVNRLVKQRSGANVAS